MNSNNLGLTFDYDEEGRLTSIKYLNKFVNSVFREPRTFKYDDKGRIISDSIGKKITIHFEYDDLDRVVRMYRTRNVSETDFVIVHDCKYRYDDVNNIITERTIIGNDYENLNLFNNRGQRVYNRSIKNGHMTESTYEFNDEHFVISQTTEDNTVIHTIKYKYFNGEQFIDREEKIYK